MKGSMLVNINLFCRYVITGVTFWLPSSLSPPASHLCVHCTTDTATDSSPAWLFVPYLLGLWQWPHPLWLHPSFFETSQRIFWFRWVCQWLGRTGDLFFQCAITNLRSRYLCLSMKLIHDDFDMAVAVNPLCIVYVLLKAVFFNCWTASPLE